jgi:coiled-coil domain-containing protein 12
LCILPKKTNHDLKRDVEKKLQRLEKRTQRAMLELMHAK